MLKATSSTSEMASSSTSKMASPNSQRAESLVPSGPEPPKDNALAEVPKGLIISEASKDMGTSDQISDITTSERTEIFRPDIYRGFATHEQHTENTRPEVRRPEMYNPVSPRASMKFGLPESPKERMYMMRSEKRMVAPGSRDAPKFKDSLPEELRRFIGRMEDLWADAGITDDKMKKTMIGKYADVDCEEQWKYLKKYDYGTWEEFKRELIANYPEAAAAERGTPERIRQLCTETSTIRLGDLASLYRFKRTFMTEARKLQAPPIAMANRELVELFISCLSEALTTAVFQYLGNTIPSTQTRTLDGYFVPRRPEDKYDLEDVADAAIIVSENSQGINKMMKKDSASRSSDREVFLFNQPVSEGKNLSDKVDEIEGVQALERDKLDSMNRIISTRIGEIENLMKMLLAQGQNHAKGDCKSGNCKMHDASSNPAQRGGKPLDNEKCFWCGLFGHFQADCEDLKNQIRAGNVKLNHEGKLRLKDGSFIPKYPAEATLKERVERHYAKKPSQYYYGEYEDSDPVPSAVPSTLGSGNDDKRVIAQLKAELDLRKREEALALKQKMLEENERKIGQSSSATRTTNIRELLEQLSDEDLAAIKTAKSGFN